MTGAGGTHPTWSKLVAALEAVEDPEVPVTLKDLGVLRQVRDIDGTVEVHLLATRIGCPGRSMMADRVSDAVATVFPGRRAEVVWEDASWSPSMVSPAGRDALAAFGYSLLTTSRRSACPYCGSESVRAEGQFGGSICKVPYTCESCGSTFDVLRSAADRATVSRESTAGSEKP